MDFFPITNNLAYFTKFGKVNASLSNYAYASQYLSSWSQNLSFSKGINLAKGTLNIGLGGNVGNVSINDSNAIPFNYETRIGYALNFGINYQIGYHQIGLGFNNIIGRSSLVNLTNPGPKVYPINFRYQTTFFIKDKIELQPYLLYTTHFENEGHLPMSVQNYYPETYSIIGLSSKYNNIKLGAMAIVRYRDINPSLLENAFFVGYDFKKISINYGNSFLISGPEYGMRFFMTSHQISLRYNFNGIEKGTQLF